MALARWKEEPDERENRLPQWAQMRLSVLRQDLASAKRKLREGETGDTETFVYGGYAEPDIGLPRGSQIVFKLADGDQLIAGITRKRGLDAVEVTCVGGRALALIPWSSNVVLLGAQRL